MKGKIFNAQEVQAILSENKTMFREVVKPQPPKDLPSDYVVFQPYKDHQHIWAIQSRGIGVAQYEKITPFSKADAIEYWREISPYQVGQKIFCKESFSHAQERWNDKTIFYKASHGNTIQNSMSVSRREKKWRSPATMHEEYSRLTLQIKSIGVEKLADITPFDCVCEGVWDGRNVMLGMSGKAVEAFKDNWNATHKKPEEKWEANPFVWKVEMEVVEND